MNRFLFISGIIISATLLYSCIGGGKQVVYKFENNNGEYEFQCTNEDTVINNSVTFSSYELYENKDDSIGIFFIYDEQTPNVKKLLSIDPVLMAPDETGTYKELPGKRYITIEFFDGKNGVTINKENKNLSLNKVIDWDKVNYSYEFVGKQYTNDNNYVTFTCHNNYNLKDKPEKLKLKVTFKWENGERVYESGMIKTDYVGRKLNPKF